MKKLVLVMVFLFLAGIFYGHPPSAIDISFDAKKQLLTAVITHDLSGSMVKDLTKHLVKTVTVTVNGNGAIAQNILSQENLTGETVQYKLRLKKGDKVNLVAVCSVFGSTGKDFIVP
jgi:hypothetical protein